MNLARNIILRYVSLTSNSCIMVLSNMSLVLLMCGLQLRRLPIRRLELTRANSHYILQVKYRDEAQHLINLL